MTQDEQRIVDCLHTITDFLSARQIGIYAGPPEGCTNPTWAQPCLIRLTKAGVLEMNTKGEFRLKHSERLHHLPADIAEILSNRKAA